MMNRRQFAEFIASSSPVILDGAMGTLRYAAGSTFNPVKAHIEYLNAGASVITADTVALTAEVADGKELQSILQECSQRVGDAVDALRQYETAGGSGRKYVAGSIWPIAGKMSIEPRKREAVYCKLAQVMIERGVDLIIVETATSVSEASAVLSAIRRSAVDVATVVSFVLPEQTDLQSAVAEYAEVAVEHDVSAVGFNCVRPSKYVFAQLESLARVSGIPVVFYPSVDSSTTPGEFVGMLRPLLRSGFPMIVGGCCGTTPAHIQSLSRYAMALEV